MTLTEFRAWLDGFADAIGEAPTPEQWAKIREKLEAASQPPVVVPTVWTTPTPPLSPTAAPTWPYSPEVTCKTFVVPAYEGGTLTSCRSPTRSVTFSAAGSA